MLLWLEEPKRFLGLIIGEWKAGCNSKSKTEAEINR